MHRGKSGVGVSHAPRYIWNWDGCPLFWTPGRSPSSPVRLSLALEVKAREKRPGDEIVGSFDLTKNGDRSLCPSYNEFKKELKFWEKL